MIIKKFLGKNEAEALEAAKKELGDSIVIMNVRSVKKKGLGGLFGAKQTEVTVALEEEQVNVRQAKTANGDPNLQGTATGQAASLAAQSPSARTAPLPELRAAGTAKSENAAIEKKLDSLENLLVNRLKQDEENANAQRVKEEEERVAALKKAAAEKADKEEAKGKTPSDEGEKKEEKELSEQDRFLHLLRDTMLENEVDELIVNQIMEDAEKTKKPDLPFDYLLANVYQKMILKFGESGEITPAKKGPKVVVFMGPTGVGKTTTIAKIASNFCISEQKKIALLTADTYRIAAAEQLRTYANILEVPFRVIYTEEEAKDAVESFADFDYIFVDTAGHSHQNAELLDNMKKLLDAISLVADCQTFLVLSATTKYKDLQKIATSYKAVSNYRLIFTKLDETTTYGNLLNLRLFADAAISYVTYGQNVPDDIEAFHPQKTVKQLLSTKH